MRNVVAVCLLVPTALVQGCSQSSSGAGPALAGDAGASHADAGVDEDAGDPVEDVLLVGNTVSGSVTFVDGRTFKVLGSVNVIPDLQDRLNDIQSNSVWSSAYATIKKRQTLKHFEPANGDRFVDDCFVSPDGNTLFASRSNLGDVAAFDLTDPGHRILWHTRVDGYKADHAAISPDGTQLVVSATTADVADVIDAKAGTIVGSFSTGHYPHQNDFTADGAHIYNGSIGDVSLPYAQDAQKGLRQITLVDAKTLQVIKTFPFPEGVRPTVVTPDEKTAYLQQSYLNGLVQYDLTTAKIVTTVTEPLSAFAMANYPTQDDYPHDSAHHGLALSGDGTKLCDAGTIDNTVSIVATSSMAVTSTVNTGLIPYWATTSADGNTCFVSLSGDNAVSVISYATGQESMRIPVGKFPQRSRLAKVRSSVLAKLSTSAG